MSEIDTGETPEPETNDDAAESGDAARDALPAPIKAIIDKERAASAKAVKDARDAQSQLAEARKLIKSHEDAGKSDAQRVEDRIREAETRADTAERLASEASVRLLRVGIAAKVGLPPDLAERLQGDDEASVMKDAEKLAELVGGRRIGGIGVGTGGSKPNRSAPSDPYAELSAGVFERIKQIKRF